MRLLLFLPLLTSFSPLSSGQSCDKICDCANVCGCSCNYRPGPWLCRPPGKCPHHHHPHPHPHPHPHRPGCKGGCRPKPTKPTTKAPPKPREDTCGRRPPCRAESGGGGGGHGHRGGHGGGHGHTGGHRGGHGGGGTNRKECMESAQLPDTAWNNRCRRTKPKRPHYQRFTFSGGQCRAIGWDDCKTPGSNNFPSMAKCTNTCRSGGGGGGGGHGHSGVQYYNGKRVWQNPICKLPAYVYAPDRIAACFKKNPNPRRYIRYTCGLGSQCSAIDWNDCQIMSKNNYESMAKCIETCRNRYY